MSCHGGNSAVELADDMLAAKDEAFSENPYRGVPKVTDIPAFCGRCHSDPSYMKRFDALLAGAVDLSDDERFDFLVDQALALPFHHVAGSAGEPVLRPEFARLFEKYRIGRDALLDPFCCPA
jgi:hypothetical protein